MATGCWCSIRHAHSREDRLLCLHESQDRQPCCRPFAGSTLLLLLATKGLPERQLGRSHLWPKHGGQYYLRCVKIEGCLCMLLLGCLLVYISTCCCPEGSMHISLLMSVRMLTVDLCNSNLAYTATHTKTRSQQHGTARMCGTFACIARMQRTSCVNKIATACDKETHSCMRGQVAG